MIYRKVGNTDMSASIIGLGTEHLDNKPYAVVEEVIDAALEHEINIMDVFMPGQAVRENIAKALKGRRDQMLIQGHIGSVDVREQYDRTRDVKTSKKYFENLMKAFQTDYIDFGMMFFIDSEKDYKEAFETEYIDYVMKLKRDGTIRAIGASSHNPETAIKMINTGVIDVLMFSINLAFDMTPSDVDVLDIMGKEFRTWEYDAFDSKRAELYQLCESKKIPITVMKTLGSGRLLSPDHTPFAFPMTVGQCIHYALTRPAVVSALIGCETEAQVAEAVSYLDLSEAERDYTQVAQTFQNTMIGKCVYCNHCQPCPVGIDIAAVTKYLDIAMVNPDQIPPSILQHYHSLEHTGADCIACGACEARCPFSVKVVENMNAAEKLFNK